MSSEEEILARNVAFGKEGTRFIGQFQFFGSRRWSIR
jgi:hypothetical protein